MTRLVPRPAGRITENRWRDAITEKRPRPPIRTRYVLDSPGDHHHGIQEVRGSTPLGSTNDINSLDAI
jgi:hypothetical protein